MRNVLEILSDIPVFHKIVSDLVPYFSLESPDSIVEAIQKTITLTIGELINLMKSSKVLICKEST